MSAKLGIRWFLVAVLVALGGYWIFNVAGQRTEGDGGDASVPPSALSDPNASGEQNQPSPTSPPKPPELRVSDEHVLGIEKLLPPLNPMPADFKREYPEVPWFVRWNGQVPPGEALKPEFIEAGKYVPKPEDVAKLSKAVNRLIDKAEVHPDRQPMPGVGRMEAVTEVPEFETWTTIRHATGVLRLPRSVKEVRAFPAFTASTNAPNRMDVDPSNVEMVQVSRRAVSPPRTEDEVRVFVGQRWVGAAMAELVVPTDVDVIEFRDKSTGKLMEFYQFDLTAGRSEVISVVPHSSPYRSTFITSPNHIVSSFGSKVWMDLVEEADLDESLANVILRNFWVRVGKMTPVETTRIGLTSSFDDVRKIEDPLERFTRAIIVAAWTSYRGEKRPVTTGEYGGMRFFIVEQPDDVVGQQKFANMLIYDSKEGYVGYVQVKGRHQFTGKDLLVLLPMHLSATQSKEKGQ